MLGGVNDAAEQAAALARLAKDCGAFVNLIRRIRRGSFVPSPAAVIRRFSGDLRRLTSGGGPQEPRPRHRRACGQLRVERLRRRAQSAPTSTVTSR